MSRVGEDGRTCGGCRFYYALAFECRCNPPTLVQPALPGGRDRAAFPPRDPDDVACGEWTPPRTQSPAGEDGDDLGAVTQGLRDEKRQLGLRGVR